jgi:Sulfotransferase domain
MALMVVGAGVGRTGTESLKLALEQLLGAPCYHMLEVLGHPESSRYWAAAGRGEMPDWDEVFEGYAACVDWPAAAFWPEISAAYVDAIVVLSTRSSAEEWYRSASATIFAVDPASMPGAGGDDDFIPGMFDRFTADIQDPEAAMAAYEAHNQRVRETVSPSRLVDWQPGDGWPPICEALGLPVPAEPFPHVNTREMFQQRLRELSAEQSPGGP